MNWYKKSQIQIATHVTDERSFKKILSTGKFIPSSSGWNGSGLYAHLGKLDNGIGKEGKGKNVIYFDISHLKLNDQDMPPELDQKEWDNLRTKDNRFIDKKLLSLGYDGIVIYDRNYIRIFPESCYKLKPFI